MQQGPIRIDLTVAAEDLPKMLKKNIDGMRQKILSNRSPTNYISYQIFFFPNTPLQNPNGEKTQKGEYFEIQINTKTIYPRKAQGKNNRYIVKRYTQNKAPQTLYIDPTYTGKYTVFDAIGVLVAEQLRFNTLDLSVQKGQFYLSPNDMFIKLWDKYEHAYKNWATMTSGTMAAFDRQKIPNGVKVVIPYQA